MRNQTLIAFLLMTYFYIGNSFGQTPLTEAIDFTATDTDGQTWNLFNELNDGKYVLIDFFLTT